MQITQSAHVSCKHRVVSIDGDRRAVVRTPEDAGWSYGYISHRQIMVRSLSLISFSDDSR